MTTLCAIFCCKAVIPEFKLGEHVYETALGPHYFVKFASDKTFKKDDINIAVHGDHCMLILNERENKNTSVLPDLEDYAKDICIEACCDFKGIGAITDCKTVQAPLLALAKIRFTYESGVHVLHDMLRERKMVPAGILPTNLELGMPALRIECQRIIWCCAKHLAQETKESKVKMRTYNIGGQVLSISVSEFSMNPQYCIIAPIKYIHQVASYYLKHPTTCEQFILSHTIAAVHTDISPDLPLELSGCQVCKKPDVKSCACKTVWYCGTVCQRADRAAHKLHCS